MQIELKNIRTVTAMSQETPCYSATVYVDGKPAVDVGNAGHGGADRQNKRREAAVEIADLEAYIACEMPPLDMSVHGMDPVPCTLEIWCHRQLDEVADRNRLRRFLKSGVVYVEGGKLTKISFKRVKAIGPEHLEYFAGKYPDVTPLNTMPFEDAWAIAKPLMVEC